MYNIVHAIFDVINSTLQSPAVLDRMHDLFFYWRCVKKSFTDSRSLAVDVNHSECHSTYGKLESCSWALSMSLEIRSWTLSFNSNVLIDPRAWDSGLRLQLEPWFKLYSAASTLKLWALYLRFKLESLGWTYGINLELEFELLVWAFGFSIPLKVLVPTLPLSLDLKSKA